VYADPTLTTPTSTADYADVRFYETATCAQVGATAGTNGVAVTPTTGSGGSFYSTQDYANVSP
jgi:hypothetical protein